MKRRTNSWKDFERWIGRECFGVERNPLSGSNNKQDNGMARIGDILRNDVAVECKKLKKGSIGLINKAVITKKAAENVSSIVGALETKVALILKTDDRSSSATVTRALTVKSQAATQSIPWIHIEQVNRGTAGGDPGIIAVALPKEEAVKMLRLYDHFCIKELENMPEYNNKEE